MNQPILDACCGGRMFWFNKKNPNVTYMDKRTYYEELPSGHVINVNPDVVADFTCMPYPDNTFWHVVFDPPHLIGAGENGWMAKKYGRLDRNTWQAELKKGFDECMRVLKPNGTLVFKWNEETIRIAEMVKLFEREPLYGNKRAKTHWLTYMKFEDEQNQ